MAKFACIQSYNDRGQVVAHVEAVEDYAIDSYKEMADKDVYVDIFDSWQEADAFRVQSINS